MSDTLKNIGLGILLSKIRFSVSVSKVHFGFGFRVDKYIQLDIQDDNTKAVVKLWCDENNLTIKYRTKSHADILKWLSAIEPYAELLHDKKGYNRMLWVIDNPIPRANPSTPTNVFYDWVKKWDDLENDI